MLWLQAPLLQPPVMACTQVSPLLLQVITVITSVVSFVAAVGSVMGMNLHFNVAPTPWASLLSHTAPAAVALHVMSC